MSLIELMVAITLGFLVILAVTTLFSQNSQVRNDIDNASQQIENGRLALNLLREDVRLAGFYGELAPAAGTAWTLPATAPTLCVSGAVSAATLGWDNTTGQVPPPVLGYEASDPVLTASNFPCITNRDPTSDVLIVRRVATTTVAVPAANTFYLQSTLCPTETATTFVVSDSSGAFTLHKKDLGSGVTTCTNAAVLRQYLVRAYYVSTCDVCAPQSDDMPTLKRVEFVGSGATKTTTVSLVEGMERFKVDYGFDTSIPADGAPDTYIKCSAGDACTTTGATKNWANVTGVKIYLLSRNPNPTMAYSDSKIYDMGVYGTVSVPANGSATDHTLSTGYRRHLFQAAIHLAGPAALKEN
jgi:type IV pilus assembly protein PilW